MSNTYKLRGRLAGIGEPRTTPSGFTFQTLLVRDESNPQYPQTVAIEFSGDRIAQLSGLAQGQEIEVAFGIRGSEYNGRHYVNLRGWGVSTIQAAPVPTVAPIAPAAPAPAERVEDLPF